TDGMAAADLNGDGKPDLVTGNGYNAIAVYKNTSTTGNIAFDAGLTTILSNTVQIQRITINDFDGDGKADILLSNNDKSTVSLLKNESTLSTMAFDAKV